MTTADRVVLLMSLVPYLIEHGPTPVTELAETFEVDPHLIRTLARFLGVAGVPGETLTYQHEDLFDIDWDALELNDVVSLTNVVAVDDTPRFSSAETAALIAGLHALLPMLPHEQEAHARSAAKKLSHVQRQNSATASVSVSTEAEHQSLALLYKALASSHRLHFQYQTDAGAITERTVHPLLVAQAGEGWYLRGYCYEREAERTFLVDRMRDIRLGHIETRQLQTPRTVFDIEQPQLVAMLRISKRAAYQIADFAPRIVSHLDDGWVRAEVDLMHPAVAVRLVQTAPGEVIIEAPESCRQAVREWTERALAQYAE